MVASVVGQEEKECEGNLISDVGGGKSGSNSLCVDASTVYFHSSLRVMLSDISDSPQLIKSGVPVSDSCQETPTQLVRSGNSVDALK